MRLSVQFIYAQLLFATHVGNNCHLSFKYKFRDSLILLGTDPVPIHVRRGDKLTFLFWTSRKLLIHPRELLKCKVYGYGTGGKTLKWIDSFLCFRQQSVEVNGIKSDWVPFCQVSLRASFWDHCCSRSTIMISQ